MSAHIRTRPTLLAAPTAQPASSDWHALFDAVTARLRLAVGERLRDNNDPLVHEVARNIQSDVLDCVHALEQLRKMLAQEVDPAADAALPRLHAEPAGTRAQPRQAHHRASHDDLTALPNRHFFRERLDRAFAPAAGAPTPPAMLHLDLDGFKAINDEHGRAVGDELLRIVAIRLSRAMRSEDVVSRLGGDEFACLLADAVNREQLSHIACKLFNAVAAPLKIGGLQLSVRPSIGIAIGVQDGSTAGELLRNAVAAMHQARRRHSGYAFFESCPAK